MWFRWLATVRSPRNSAAATSRLVLPSATRAATRRSAAVSPSARVRPLIRPSSLRAFRTHVAAPSCSNRESAASIASRAVRFCRRRRRTTYLEEPLGGADAELADMHWHAYADSTCEQQSDVRVVQPAERERECACRRLVEPLDVVDRDQ